MDIFEEREIANRKLQRIANSMARAGAFASPDDDHPSEQLIRWIRTYAAEEAEEGEILTPLLWMDGGQGIVARKALSGDSPYPDPGAIIRLRNVSGRPLTVKVEVKTRTERGLQISEGQSFIVNVAHRRGAAEYTSVKTTEVEPGQTIDLGVVRAAQALGEHSYRSKSPELWGISGAIPQRADLVEVGYAVPPSLEDRINSPQMEPTLGGEMREPRKRKAS